MKRAGCELCERVESAAWTVVASDERLRVVRVLDAPDFPAFYRVIWNDHVAELSDLASADRAHCLQAVVVVEQALRDSLSPTKINLAALGNMVPHLHWHVIARFDWDSHFPAPVWAAAARQSPPEPLAMLRARLAALDQDIQRRLSAPAAAAPM